MNPHLSACNDNETVRNIMELAKQNDWNVDMDFELLPPYPKPN